MGIEPNIVGLLSIGLFFLLLLMNLPIFLAFLIPGLIGMAYLIGFKAAIMTTMSTFWAYGTSSALMAIPLFLLMGQFASEAGIGRDLYNAASKWMGKLPGGLAIATIWGSAGFAACTGSSTTGVVAFGAIAYRPMLENNYDPRLSVGSIICGSTMGAMIPPSIGFIVYGIITEESIGRLFMAGFFPGILEAVLYTIPIVMFASLGIWKGPPGPPSSWKEKFVSLRGVWGMLTLFILVLGGIYVGMITPNEGGAIGAAGALIILIIRRGLSPSIIKITLRGCVKTSCMIFTIIIGAMVFARFVALSGLVQLLGDTLVGLPLPPMFILGLALSSMIIVGCVIPATPMIVLLTPLLYPIFVGSFGFSGIWFGVLLVTMVEIAVVTPPVGVNLFIAQQFITDIRLSDIYIGILPFIACDIIRVAILVLCPQISLWLPSMMFQ